MTQKLNLFKLKLNQKTPMPEQTKEESNAERETGTSDGKAEAEINGSSGPDEIPEGHAESRANASKDRSESKLFAGFNRSAKSHTSEGEIKPEAVDSDTGTVDSPVDSSSRGGNSNRPNLLTGLKLGKQKSVNAPSAHLETDSAEPGAPDDDLTALAMSESSGVAPLPDVDESVGFADEIPATAPERKLPEGLDEQQKRFVDSLDGIYAVLSDPELFGQMIRNIMSELQQQPQYEQLLCDDDVAVMIRGMRESMNLARMRKTEKKRTTGGRKAKAEESNEVLDELKALARLLGGLD